MKVKLLLLLCLVTLGLSSCKKDTIVQDTPNRTIIYTIQPQDWVPYPDGKGFKAITKLPEVDELNVDIEGILVYLDHPEDVNSYIQLPYVYNGYSYSYKQVVGGITVEIQTSEYSTVRPTKPDGPIRMKVVLIPSKDVT